MLVGKWKKLGSRVHERHKSSGRDRADTGMNKVAGGNLPTFPPELFISRPLLEGFAYSSKESFP